MNSVNTTIKVDPDIQELILRKREKNGFVILNVGAGSCSSPDSPFINCDIAEESKCAIICPMDTIPLPDNSVDYIFALHVVEHVRPAQLLFALKEWKRVLRDGGGLLIETPDLQKVIRVLAFRRGSTFAVPKRFVLNHSHRGVRWISGMLYGHLCQEPVNSNELLPDGFLPNIHKWLYCPYSIGQFLKDQGFTNVKTFSRGIHFFDLMCLAWNGHPKRNEAELWTSWDNLRGVTLPVQSMKRYFRVYIEYIVCMLTGWSRYGKNDCSLLKW